MTPVRIIIADWNGYPLVREKSFPQRQVECGLERLFHNMKRFDPGCDMECDVIISRNQTGFPFRKKDDSSTPHAAYEDLVSDESFIRSLRFRSNVGMDIGAYDSGLQRLRKEHYTGDVVFMNSSVEGPMQDNWLARYKDLFHGTQRTGIVGVSLNSSDSTKAPAPFKPHVQSYFLYSSMKVLDDVFPRHLPFWRWSSRKTMIIRRGEIEISRRVLAKGYGISCSNFPDFIYFKGGEWTIPMSDFRFDAKHCRFPNRL